MFRGRGGRDFREGLVLGVAGVLLAVAGCSGDPTAADDGPYNSADVAFAQRTITHHRQGLELTALADERARDSGVRELADDIEATQEAEIEQLAGWLDEWGEDVPGADTHADEKLPGLVSEDQLVKLSASSGAAWRELFLTYQIEHARGAIELAADEEANGKHPGALELAAEIQVAQQAEIQRIEALLG
jgi:uncharacterized protein (DUF305 family)